MQDKSDIQLLRDYAERQDETAFREIVGRHTDFVYSAAWRQVESADLAADVAQSVFVDLAHKAKTVSARLAPESSLAGWLHRATRFAALNHLRDNRRRVINERQAMNQLLTDSESSADWGQIRPALDEALDSLGDEDREALLLRYFKNLDFRAVGFALGVSDDTAQKRVSRAVEHLREFFSKRKVTLGASGLAAVISANAIQAAPAGLAVSIFSAALAGTAVSTSTVITATKTIVMTTLQKTAITAALAAAVGTGIYEARQAARWREENQAFQQRQASLAEQIQQLQQEREEMANRLSALADEIEKGKGNSLELLKLRAEVTRLRGDSRELAQRKATEANDPAQAELKSWLAHVAQLKHEAETNPRARIPEFSLLTEQDWLNAAKWYGRRPQFDAETDLRVAMAELRQSAQNAFANLAQQALARYVKDHDGHFPTDLARFKPYLPISVDGRAVDDTILDRYKVESAEKLHTKVSQDWVITQKELVDEYDHVICIGPVGWSYQQSDAELLPPDVVALKHILDPVAKEFSAANNGHAPNDPSQLLPYLKTDEQRTALQKAIELRNSSMRTNN